MIRGVVNSRCEAVVQLQLQGPSGTEVDVFAIVDAGFTASVALPPATVSSLGLIRQSGGSARLADGSVRQFEIYAANVEWDGHRRPVLVSAVGDEVLVGMQLLRGYQLRVDVFPGGLVEIVSLRV